MKSTFGKIGCLVLILFIFFALLCIFLFLLKGGFWLSNTLLPFIGPAFYITLIIDLLIALPLSIPKSTRGYGAILFLISSYVFGVIAWVWSFIITYTAWGLIALIIGLVFAGIGVTPIAFVATLVTGHILITFQLLILIGLTFGIKSLSYYIASKV